jgi:hypothetical protein
LVFSYIVWVKKGYQQFQEPRGTSIIKVKGIAKVTGNNTSRYVRMLRQKFFVLKNEHFFKLRCRFTTSMGYS